jgi:hypothetical protein
MADGTKQEEKADPSLLTPDQAALLDMYIQTLDTYLDNVKASEQIQVEIETLHLKKILSA